MYFNYSSQCLGPRQVIECRNTVFLYAIVLVEQKLNSPDQIGSHIFTYLKIFNKIASYKVSKKPETEFMNYL